MDVQNRIDRKTVSFCTYVLLSFVFVLAMGQNAWSAQYKTQNFTVTAETAELAKKVGDTAERCRQELAVLWTGNPMRPWSQPCPISVKANPNLGAGGETSFTFADGEVFDWKMKVQGSEERILDSVIPHEVSHTILASYFRKPVPRWIDEGAATSVETGTERDNYRQMLVDFLKKGRGIPFNTMVRQKEYPADQMPFYAQGFSVCEYLIMIGGQRRLIEFTKAGMAGNDWSNAIHEYYGYDNLGALQVQWQNWISSWYLAGMPSTLPAVNRLPALEGETAALVAAQTTAPVQPTGRLVPATDPSEILTTTVASSGWVPLSQGVGSATPDNTLIPSANEVAPPIMASNTMTYQGSYGKGITSGMAVASGNPIPPISGSDANIRILGQQNR